MQNKFQHNIIIDIKFMELKYTYFLKKFTIMIKIYISKNFIKKFYKDNKKNKLVSLA